MRRSLIQRNSKYNYWDPQTLYMHFKFIRVNPYRLTCHANISVWVCECIQILNFLEMKEKQTNERAGKGESKHIPCEYHLQWWNSSKFRWFSAQQSEYILTVSKFHIYLAFEAVICIKCIRQIEPYECMYLDMLIDNVTIVQLYVNFDYVGKQNCHPTEAAGPESNQNVNAYSVKAYNIKSFICDMKTAWAPLTYQHRIYIWMI